ncbi:hypothetical protein LTS18_006614, partial [Coniosporium uncinatum]
MAAAPEPVSEQKLHARKAWFGRSTTESVDDGWDNVKSVQINDFPQGYPRLAAFASSDTNTRLFRRFTYVRVRLLFDLQGEILELEEQLPEQDNADALPDADGKRPHAFRLTSRRWDLGTSGNAKRREILTKLNTSLKEYDELLLREQQILSLPRPHYHSFRSVFNYIWKEKPLREEERRYIDHRADMLRLAPEYEGAWADRTVDRA